MTKEPILQCITVLSTEARFVRHRIYPVRTKTFVLEFFFVFVFVLVHEQPIRPGTLPEIKKSDFKTNPVDAIIYFLE